MSGIEEATEYWNRRLSPLPQEAALPADLPYPLSPTGHWDTRVRALDVAAPEPVLLAAFVALLHRYGGAGDVTVGYEGLPLRVAVTGTPPSPT